MLVRKKCITFRTTSEISKSFIGSGIFRFACTVFSSPGSRAVRATYNVHKLLPTGVFTANRKPSLKFRSCKVSLEL